MKREKTIELIKQKEIEIEDLKGILLNIPTKSIKESLDNVFATKFSYHHFERVSSEISGNFIDNKTTDLEQYFIDLFQYIIPEQYNDYVELCYILEQDVDYTEEYYNKMFNDTFIRKYDKKEFLQFFEDIIYNNKNR